MSIDKKRQLVKENIIAKYNGDLHNPKCARALRLIDLMCESNIPVGYWFIRMKEFQGSLKLKISRERMQNRITHTVNTVP